VAESKSTNHFESKTIGLIEVNQVMAANNKPEKQGIERCSGLICDSTNVGTDCVAHLELNIFTKKHD
jgi:hypothetical protein